MTPNREMILDIAGLGIMMYSPFAVSHIREGEDYFRLHYERVEDVLDHVYAGTIVGFCTGSPGTYVLRFMMGSPRNGDAYGYRLSLGIEVRDRKVCVRDVFDLLWWVPSCPPEQTLELEDGFYQVTLGSGRPPSGIVGDDQVIDVYLYRVAQMPAFRYDDIPQLWDDQDYQLESGTAPR